MCTHQRNIISRSKSYTEGSTKFRQDVPCGHCDDCRLNAKRDWTLRTWSEIERYNLSGGKVAFVTFTYRNNDLPLYPIIREDGTTQMLMCFNQDHKTEYIKSIRDYFYREYGLVGDTNKPKAKYNRKGMPLIKTTLPLRYMWCCEYGMDNRSTHRPHYHVLLFIPPEILKTSDFKTENKAKHFLRERWDYGWTIFSPAVHPQTGRPLGLYVQTEFAADYVGKYCFKDLDWYANPLVDEYLRDSDGYIDKEKRDAMGKYLPGHWQSKSFGSALVEDFDDFDTYLKGKDFHFLKNALKGITVRSYAPRYIERKLLYTQLPDGRYVLNEKGIDWKVKAMPVRMKKVANKIADTFTLKGINECMSDTKISEVFKDFGVYNRYDLRKYITEILGIRTYYELALFYNVWDGLFIVDKFRKYDYPKQFAYLDTLSLDEFINASQEQYYLCLTASKDPDKFDDDGYFMNKKNYDENTFRYYSECNRFTGFVQLIHIFKTLRSSYLQDRHIAYLRDEANRKYNKLKGNSYVGKEKIAS